MICETCENHHNGEYGSGRFCSTKCSRSFSTRDKRSLINEKVRKKLLGTGNPSVEIICKNCTEKFTVLWKKKKQTYCSPKCAHESEDHRKKLSEKGKIRCSSLEERQRLRNIGRKGGFGAKGKTQGGISYQSRLEKICFEYLENKKVLFTPHKNIPNSSKVSDIYIHHLNLWIEIDGINREKRKDWLGNDYYYWLDKLKIYKEQNLNYIIVYSLEDLKKIL